MNYFEDIFQEKARTEYGRAFRRLQSTFNAMLLAFGCYFLVDKRECFKKRTFIVAQKDISRGAFEKKYLKSGKLLFFDSLFSLLKLKFGIICTKKREKHPWRRVTFSTVAGWNLRIYTKRTILHGCFSRFFKLCNGTKSRKTSQLLSSSKSVSKLPKMSLA